MTRRSIFDAAGGQEAFGRLAAAHHQRCLEDPVLEHPFSHGGHPQHVERLGFYGAEVFGGPPRYSEVSAGQSFMLGLHAGMEAQEDLGARFMTCFLKAIDDADLPDDADLRGQLHAYMAWAVAVVHGYNPRGSVVPGRLPVPHWSWDGLEPAPTRRV